MCTHSNKCYANWSYCTNPPITPFICRDCGYHGEERGQYIVDEYEQLKQQFTYQGAGSRP